MDKAQIRAVVRSRKRAMTGEEIARKSGALVRLLLAHPLYREARTICGYYPVNSEVRLLPALERAMAQGKRVALPKVCGGEMRFVVMSDLHCVAAGFGGIPEPIADEPPLCDPRALVLLPGLAFDAAGHRIGYGGGYYDRFLAREPLHPTIALCYDFQMFPQLPAEPFDVPAQAVLWA